MAFIMIKDVYHDYCLGKVAVNALKGVNIEIDEGEMVALIGPSGSGKTTVINLLGTIDSPTRGEIYVDSINLNNLPAKERIKYRRRKISFIFQFFNLFPTLNVLENTEFPLLFSPVSRREMKERVTSALETVGLGGLEHRKIDELSGGQRQRVAIARALVTKAPIVLADEPTGNLDGETAEIVMELMKKINADFGTTFLFSTHDPRVMKYANKIIELRDGRVEKVKVS